MSNVNMPNGRQMGKSLIVALTTFPPHEIFYICVSETGTLEGPYNKRAYLM